MADDTLIAQEQVQESPEQQQQAAAKAELDQLMARNLGIGLPPGRQPVLQPNVARETLQQEQQSNQEQAVIVPEFKFDTFKAEFGYEKPEDIVAEIKTLRAKAATPSTPTPELKFENEQSEKLFKAFTAGKQKEVLAYLAEQDRLENITSKEVNESTAEEIIKTGMQFKYKGLTPDMINHRFNKQFGLPKEPLMKADEELEDFERRKAQWQEQVAEIKMERQIEANLIKPELEIAKSKLVIPEIPQTVDQEYLDWKKEQDEIKTVNAEVYEAYKQFKASDIETKIAFSDEAKKVAFEFQYVPDEKAFKTSQELVTDIDKFYATFRNQDGSPDRKGFIAAVDFMVNKDKIISAAISQGINAYIKSQLPDNQPNQTQRQVVLPTEETELQKQMRLRGIKSVV